MSIEFEDVFTSHSFIKPDWGRLKPLPDICLENVTQTLLYLENMRLEGAWTYGNVIRQFEDFFNDPFKTQFEERRQEILEIIYRYGGPNSPNIAEKWADINVDLLTGVDNMFNDKETYVRRLAWWQLESQLGVSVGKHIKDNAKAKGIKPRLNGFSQSDFKDEAYKHMANVAQNAVLWAINGDRGFDNADNLYLKFVEMFKMGAILIDAKGFAVAGDKEFIMEFPAILDGKIHHAGFVVDENPTTRESVRLHPKGKCFSYSPRDIWPLRGV